MMIGLLFSLLIGWVVGGVGNWLADGLPHLPERPLQFVRAHFLRVTFFPWRVAESAQEAHPVRRTLLAVGMAAAFGMGWLRFGGDPAQVDSAPLLVVWCYSLWLLLVLVIDLEHHRVLNRMLPPAIALSMVVPVLSLLGWDDLPGFRSVLLGGGAGFALFLAIFILGRGRMMGAGDVKLAGVIGLMVGYPLVFFALVWGIVLGGVAAIFLLVRRRGSAKSYMAYGPYLALGALFVLWFLWP